MFAWVGYPGRPIVSNVSRFRSHSLILRCAQEREGKGVRAVLELMSVYTTVTKNDHSKCLIRTPARVL